MSILKGLTPPSKTRPCHVAEVAKTLGKEDEAILMNAVKDPMWGIIPLSNALAQRGLTLSRTTLERHRKGICACSKI